MTANSISILDGKAVPVARVFLNQNGQIGNQPATWYEKIGSFSSLAWNKLTTAVVLATKPKGDHKLSMQIHLPVVRLVDGSEVLDGTLSSFITMIVPANLATDANLKDLKALTANSMDHAVANEIFVQTKPSTSFT